MIKNEIIGNGNTVNISKVENNGCADLYEIINKVELIILLVKKLVFLVLLFFSFAISLFLLVI